MKKFQYLWALIMLMAFSTHAFSQSSIVDKNSDAKDIANDTKRYGLKEAQVKEWKKIRNKYRVEMKKIRENPKLTKKQKVKALQIIETKKDNDIKAILAPEQYQKYLEHKKTKKATRQGKRKGKSKKKGKMKVE